MTHRLRLSLHDDRGLCRLTPANVARLRGALEDERSACFVTLEGDGDVFCDGMDLPELTVAGEGLPAHLEHFAALLHAIGTTPRPVIALVGGRTLGGGLGLLAAADLVIATPRATCGLPETLFGLVPAVVLPVIAARIGIARARWLAMSGRTVSAEESQAMGLVDEVTEDLEGALARHAARLARLDVRAVAQVKALAASLWAPPASYRASATAIFAGLAESTATRARITRYLEGETPWPEREAT